MKLKRICFALICLCLFSAMLLLCTSAAEDTTEIVDSGNCGKNVTWTLDSEGTLTIDGNGNMYLYGSNGGPWYSRRNSVRSVVVKQGVTSIGDWAFYGCSSLTSITIPNSVTSIGNGAFLNCISLTSITIPNSATSIGESAFSGCSSLTGITIPDGVTSIGRFAFYGCSSLTSITIPDGVTSIGIYAFYGCSSLTSITIPDGVTSIGNWAFSHCSSLTSITISDGVTSIGYSAFSGCRGLTSITLPDSVTSIGESAFSGCSSLTCITLPDSVTSIGESAFSGCSSLTSITIPDGVTSIGYRAFWGCNRISSIYLSGIESWLSLWSQKIPVCSPRVIYLNGEPLSDPIIPESVTSIGDNAFSGCASLTSITIPESVTSIGNSAFSGCASLTSITIPESVTNIGEKAFYNCTGLTSITIPENVTSIGGDAFSGCTGLTSIYYNARAASATPSGSSEFPYVFFKAGSKYGGTKVIFGNAVEAIPACLFAGTNNNSLSSITISDSVTSIGEWAFYNCTGLTSITIPESVTSIEDGAFSGCTSLTSITIPKSVRSIGGDAFYNCTGLTSITIPESLPSIGGYAFSGCNRISSIYLSSLEGWLNFWCRKIPSCSRVIYLNGEPLSDPIIPESVTSIVGSMFSGCTSLTSITIPDGVTSIEGGAFSGCSNIGAIFFSGNAPFIADNAFKSVTAVAFYPSADETWESKKINYGGTLYWASYNPSKEIVASGLCGDNIIWQIDKNGTLTVKGSGILTDVSWWSLYKAMITGVVFSGTITMTQIPKNGFAQYARLKSLILPSGIKSIEEKAFCDCTSLTSITIPDGVTSIGERAFSGCTGLTSITIPESVISIGGEAFIGCENISSVYITDIACWLKIYFAPFYGYSYAKNPLCYGAALYLNNELLTDLVIPEGTTKINAEAFYNCTSLKRVVIPSSVTAIGTDAFSQCRNLERFEVSEENKVYCSDTYGALMSKGKTTLYICPAQLSGSYVVQKETREIASMAFRNCSRLKSIIFLGAKPSIESDSFYGVTADAYYPESLDSDVSWTQGGALVGYGGTLNWKPWYTLGDDPLCEHVLEDTVVPPSCTWGYTLHKCACGYSYRTDFELGSGHDMVIDKAVPATCTETGLTEGSHCSRCDYKVAQEVTPKLGHDMITDAAVPATCTETGLTEGSHCSRCDYKVAQEVTPKLGHDMVTDAAVPATCTETGLTEGSHCSRCDYKVAQEVTPKLGHDMITDAAVPATCTKTGLTEGSHCSRCDYKVVQEVTPKLGHDMITDAAIPATCTETGLTEGSHCSRCDYKVAQEVTPKLGHDWDTPRYAWSSDHSAITATRVCKNDASHTESEQGKVSSAVTKEATYDAEGEITYTAAFTSPAFATQTAVVKTPRLERPTPAENPFTDLANGSYYYDAVLWAVENGVTAGTSANAFSPDNGCTRAQVVTFLWRAAGQPEPSSNYNPFTDVDADAYYYKAVLWAVEHNVTSGTSATTFSPDGTCTRAQIVTFLWRYEGQPEPKTASNPFSDVAGDAYFAKAVLWAAENGVTSGTSATTFSPEATCTRAQVVTFLYRDVKKS